MTTAASAGVKTARIAIGGMDCADCARTISASVESIPGVRSVAVNVATGAADITWDEGTSPLPAVADRIRALGYSAETPAAAEPWTFDVSGMDCADCAQTIEVALRRNPSVASASVNFGLGRLSVVPADDRLTTSQVGQMVQAAGYRAALRADRPVRDHVPFWKARRTAETAAAAILWLAGFALEHSGAGRIVTAIPYLAAMALAGYPVARAALFSLRARRADMNVLMTIAAIGAVAIGEWGEGTSVLILFGIGLMLQTLSLDRTRRAISALMELAPDIATVIRNGSTEVVPVDEVGIGEMVLVRAGDRVPVDGEIVSGESALDQSSITGESIPVEVGPGNAAFSGSINGDGVLRIRTTRRAGESTLARIIHLVEEAQGSRAPAQAFVDRFAAIYTPIVVAAAIVIALVVPLFAGDWREWIFRALVLLVVACPCALVISTPVALVAAIGGASRRGVLFKGGAAIEALASVRSVAFDKTGTLTEGRPAVTSVTTTGALDEDAVLALAAAVDSDSTHPIARGIVAAAAERGLPLPAAAGITNRPGLGAQATVDGETVVVGSRRAFPDFPASIAGKVVALEQRAATVVLVGTPRGVEGLIALADPVREASRNAVRDLRELGLTPVMLSGDNHVTAAQVAAQVGVTDIRAELLPERKVDAIREIQGRGPVAMIGDGVNDAPALATADVGIAMGVAGTDVALEAADVALMSDDLSRLPEAIRLARRTLATIRVNITAAILVKAIVLV
ncbi:MAG: cadmium-translocating P-type ATPase, partial [Chloroflexota bacterium]|nr:cadmium-translocating P-type ATPase [Chloroflexota bacterium]